jgi:hypothetical protein
VEAKMEVPKKPEIPTYTQQRSERTGENRARLGWEIKCTKCKYEFGTTNYPGARDATLKRLESQGKKCPECGNDEWEAIEISD